MEDTNDDLPRTPRTGAETLRRKTKASTFLPSPDVPSPPRVHGVSLWWCLSTRPRVTGPPVAPEHPNDQKDVYRCVESPSSTGRRSSAGVDGARP